MIGRRLAAQLLTGPPAVRPEDVVDRLLAVQAQEPRGARLAVRSRSSGLTAADVDHALSTGRTLVVTWLCRGTLHLVSAEDYWWLHPLTTPQLATSSTRRLRQEGVGPRQVERGIEVVVRAVGEGPQTRRRLRERLEAARVPTRGQALVHVLLAASLRGHVVRGPVVGGEQAWVAPADWLGPAPPPLERDQGLALLARRYLTGHGPADARDLARWAGVPLRDAQRGMDGIAHKVERGRDGLVDLADRAPAAELPPPRLLGAYDPLLLGWVSREPVVGAHQQVVTSNGLFRPVALVDGRVVATWGLAAGQVTISALEAIAPDDLTALREDAAEVLRFLGLPPSTAVLR